MNEHLDPGGTPLSPPVMSGQPPFEGNAAGRHAFLSNVGHELRNPLTTLIAQVEILMEGVHGPLEAAQHSALASVQDSARQMLHLLADTIDLLKMEAAEPPLTPAVCVMSEIVAQSLPAALDLARARSVKIQNEISPGIRVLADARLLRQVISETLSAAALTAPTGETILFTIGEEAAGLRLRSSRQPLPAASVAHTILGVGAVASSPWLDRLGKLKPVGTALLLRAASLLRGTVSIHEDGGQIFGVTVHLPLKILPPDTETQRCDDTSQPAAQEPASQAPTQAATILIADDQQALITVVSNYLENLGFEMVIARDGREAVDLAAIHRPDLILMDVRMPVMDGVAAIREIRSSSDQRLRTIPIISLSGIIGATDKEECLDAGATDYLSKPFGIRELDRIIGDHLRPKT